MRLNSFLNTAVPCCATFLLCAAVISWILRLEATTCQNGEMWIHSWRSGWFETWAEPEWNHGECAVWNASRSSSSLALVTWGQQVSCQKQTKAPWEILEILYSMLAFAFAWCISLFVLSSCSPFAGFVWPGATQSGWTSARYCQTWSEKRSEAVQDWTSSHHFCSWFLFQLHFQDFYEHLYAMFFHVMPCHALQSFIDDSDFQPGILGTEAWFGLCICAKHHRLRSCRGSPCDRVALPSLPCGSKIERSRWTWQSCLAKWAMARCHTTRKHIACVYSVYSINLIAIFWEHGQFEKSVAHGSDWRVGISMWATSLPENSPEVWFAMHKAHESDTWLRDGYKGQVVDASKTSCIIDLCEFFRIRKTC